MSLRYGVSVITRERNIRKTKDNATKSLSAFSGYLLRTRQLLLIFVYDMYLDIF